MSSRFDVGDVVVLKTKSPDMTVTRIHTNIVGDATSYSCSWFAGSTLKQGTFPEEALDKKPEEGSK